MSSEGLDPQAILLDLRLGGVRSIAPVHGGWDTALWRVESDRGTFALRVFRADQRQACQREMAAMEAAATTVRVPRVEAHTVWRDRPALLLTWCAGRTLLHELQLKPWRTLRLGLAFGRAHAQIHRVAPPAALGNGTAWIDWLGPEDLALQQRLRALPSSSAALLHLDYHPLNVMVDRRGVVAVLDWANAEAGDPRADLARTWSILRLAPTPPSRMSPLIKSLRRFLEFAWQRGYRQESPLRGDPALFKAWATAAMVRDLAPKLGKPGVWLQPRHLASIRREADHWQRRVGVSDA